MLGNIKNIVLFGDTFGISQLLKYIPNDRISAVVCASIRASYIDEIKEISQKLEIPFLVQPKFNSNEYRDFIVKISNLKTDLLICNSYSMIIREDIRNLFNNNCINVHWSLLPKNRGPNPIQWAIINNEKKTGITIHYIDENIDTGDIITQKEVVIEDKDTWIILRDKLLLASDILLKKELINIIDGNIVRTKQDEKLATTNFRLDENYPKINFSEMNNNEIYNLIRAQVSPLSGAYIELEDSEKKYINHLISYDEVQNLREKYAK